MRPLTRPPHPAWNLVFRVFVLAVTINYPWELAEASFYRGMETDGLPWRHCFVASLGDGVMVLVIFLVGLAVFGQRDWCTRPGISGYALMLAAGLSLAVVVEWLALATRRWEYRPAMPMLPGLAVGLLPTLQMLLLPALVFRLAACDPGASQPPPDDSGEDVSSR